MLGVFIVAAAAPTQFDFAQLQSRKKHAMCYIFSNRPTAQGNGGHLNISTSKLAFHFVAIQADLGLKMQSSRASFTIILAFDKTIRLNVHQG